MHRNANATLILTRPVESIATNGRRKAVREPELKIEKIELSKLKPYDNNAKIHTHEQIDAIEASIKEFGFRNPIIVWANEDGIPEIVAGHARAIAAKNIGLETVPCIHVDDLTDAQRRALVIVDNQTTMMTGWDEDMLAYELDVLANEIDMSTFGFTDEMQADELSAVEEDELPEEIECKAKYGDVFVLGRHRVMCGNSTCREDIEKLTEGGRADMLLTDPPYNISYTGKTTDALTIQGDSYNTESEFEEFLTNTLSVIVRFMKDGAASYLFMASMHLPALMSAMACSGINPKQLLVWVKNTFALGRQDYQWRHEHCVYGWKDGRHYFFDSRQESTVYEDQIDPERMTKQELADTLKSIVENKATDVLKFDKPSRNAEHPTMKPVKLFAYLMRNSSKKGQIVIDPFAGSGTTLIAAEQLGRTCWAMEVDPKYVDVIVARWEKMTGLQAVKE